MTIYIKKYLLAVLFVLIYINVSAQQLNIPLADELNYRIEKNFYTDSNFFSEIKPYRFKKELYDSIIDLTFKKKNLIFDKLSYEHLYTLRAKAFLIDIDPIITILPEYSTNSAKFSADYKFGFNTNAYIGRNLSINFNVFYGAFSFDNYWQTFIDSVKVIPHYGTYSLQKDNNYKYWSLNGYIAYHAWKYFNFEIGKGKNFFGESYRSLFLSDNANSNFYFKTSVAISKFRYIWLISSLKDENTNNPGILNNKLQFTHFLSWKATKWFKLNFFESIISNPVDSLGISYFNINYLNPVIFYRPIEFAGGSADNALMGLALNIKLWKKYSFYSQFLIDEFVIAEIKAKNAWWGNKFAIQAGLKIFDLFNIDNLMLQTELNIIRPYTYSYSNSILNYGNYKQALAHPSGANLKEAVFVAHYHKKIFSVQLKTIYQISGLDTNAYSFGKNIYMPYTQRYDDYGNTITQGLKTTALFTELKASCFVNPKSNMLFQIVLSSYKINNTETDIHNFSISLGIKTLIFNENLDYLY